MITLIGDTVNRRSFLRGLGASVVGLAGQLAFGNRVRASSAFRAGSHIPQTSSDVTRDESYWRAIRAQFPLTKERVYFNNGGLGPSPYSVIETVHSATLRLESISETGHGELEGVRRKAAMFLGCEPDEIAFTRNTTEGMNLIARGLPLKSGDEVLMSTHEHVGGALPWLALMREQGIRVRLFEPGRTAAENLQIIRKNLTRKTKVLSISHMTCTIGQIFPAREIGELCRERGIVYVLDGAHPPGQMRVNLHELGCDFYATSGHKWLLGPKGTGMLYIRKDMHNIWKPPLMGAYSSENYDLDRLSFEYLQRASCVEYGTRNIPLVLGLGAAIEFLDSIGIERIEARNRWMAGYLMEQLANMPEIEVLTPIEPTSRCGIVAFRASTKPYQWLVEQLGGAGFRVRPVGEHKLEAVRVSCHLYTLKDDVDRFLDTLRGILRS